MSERVIVDFMNNVIRQLYDIRLAIVLIFVWLLGITYKLFHKSKDTNQYDLRDGPTPPLKNGDNVIIIDNVTTKITDLGYDWKKDQLGKVPRSDEKETI